MTPSQKVVSLETAKRLKAKGFPQDTERWWTVSSAVISPDAEYHLTSHPFDWGEFHKIAAPDATEIGELLPQRIPYEQGYLWIETCKLPPKRDDLDQEGWECSITLSTDDGGSMYLSRHLSEAEARAACWLWLKEQKLI